ncbi:uncharacterized protein LOC129285823 isoform X2 [Prosopis cineraria]|uniref:uncharacterized protein LOC129285823 isoform X2 n=1 Tax=Prosopis cineraria TaxID=364024 RepID=UPI00240EF321|nr:uncharacterized protein LOC129285823 isoform X2 [Prosopis cineraria]
MQEITIIHVLHTSLWQRICMAWSGGSSIYIWMSLRKIELATQEADQKRREKLVSQFFEGVDYLKYDNCEDAHGLSPKERYQCEAFK